VRRRACSPRDGTRRRVPSRGLPGGLQWSAGVHEIGATLILLDKFDAEQLLVVIERLCV